MSFSSDDDTRTLLQFLQWYDRQTIDGTSKEIVKRFIDERDAERARRLCERSDGLASNALSEAEAAC